MTDTEILESMRSFAEMQAIYESGEKLEPYVIDAGNDGQELVFIGTRHSTDPDDPQYPVVMERWQEFLATTNGRKQIVLIEGGIPPVATSPEAAIRAHSESSLMVYLANQARIESVSAEPSDRDEANHLAATYGQENVLLFYVVRQTPQWHREREVLNEPIEPYLQNTLDGYKKRTGWEIDASFDHMRELFAGLTGEALDPMNEDQATDNVNPGINHSQLNDIARDSGRFRDLTIARTIKKYWNDGVDIFTCYGSGHAYTLEPVIEQLTKA